MSLAQAEAGDVGELGAEAPEAPWRRATRALLKKKIAAVCLVVIFIIYGAGAYTLLDVVGAPTGLQDPTAQNLTLRRPVREAEPLGPFLARHGGELATVSAINPDLVEEFGPLTADTQLPVGTQVVLQPDQALRGPSGDHFFGTDRLGRDVFSRVLFSARTTVVITVLSFLFGSVFLGLGLGLLAGYRGGWVDSVIMRVGDVFLALPGLLILIIVNAALRERWSDLWHDFQDFAGTDFFTTQGIDDFSLLFLVLSLFGWVDSARFIRAQTLSLREQEFILAAESIGAGTGRILVRHLFPAVLPWIIVGMSASLGAVAGAEIALTWLGVGIEPPTASFGVMITQAGGARTFDLHPHMLLAPGITIMLILLAFNLLGDAINDVANPRGRSF